MLVGVLNPVSGRGTAAKRLPGVREIATRLGRILDIVESRGPGGVVDAVRSAVGRHPDAVVLIGGDGSVGEACRAYSELEPTQRPPVVLVPGGRGNSFYKAALSDAPWPDYVERALRAPDVRAIDAARVSETGDVWALGCSLSFFHDSVRAASTLKGFRGRALYAAAGAYAAARLKSFRIEVDVDGRAAYVGSSVLTALAGGPFRGGRLLLHPKADLSDGLLDVVVVEDTGTRRFAEFLGAAQDGGHVGLDGVHVFQGKRIELRSPDPMRCELDGTICPVEGALTCEVLPGVLPLAYPGWGWDDVAVEGRPR